MHEYRVIEVKGIYSWTGSFQAKKIETIAENMEADGWEILNISFTRNEFTRAYISARRPATNEYV